MERIGSTKKTIETIQKHAFQFQKKFGQNFLIDLNILDKIIAGCGIESEDYVIEIGPGIGSLTQALAEKAKKVFAIEIDRNLIPILEETMKAYDNVEIICEDVLKVDLMALVAEKCEGKPVRVVANLPYYITTPIIMRFFEERIPMKSMTIMVQKEVAERMQSGPGTKVYGALSLAVQYYATAKIIAMVPPHCFMPAPTVASAVIHLESHITKPVESTNEKLLFQIIHSAFNQRRKTMMNALSNLGIINDKEVIRKVLIDQGINESIRGEALTLKQFAEFTNAIDQIRKDAKNI